MQPLCLADNFLRKWCELERKFKDFFFKKNENLNELHCKPRVAFPTASNDRWLFWPGSKYEKVPFQSREHTCPRNVSQMSRSLISCWTYSLFQKITNQKEVPPNHVYISTWFDRISSEAWFKSLSNEATLITTDSTGSGVDSWRLIQTEMKTTRTRTAFFSASIRPSCVIASSWLSESNSFASQTRDAGRAVEDDMMSPTRRMFWADLEKKQWLHRNHVATSK